MNTVYSAIYSGVPVYETICRDIPIMRRMADSFLNATQILKVCGFTKPQRTKILEVEVMNGVHEKIQGGYGKYQGTWVPLIAGRVLAQRYNVEHELGAILNFDPAIDHVGIKPVIKKAPKAKLPSVDVSFNIENDLQHYVDDQIQRRTPVRSRAPSYVSGLLASPERSNIVPANQEPTPKHYVHSEQIQYLDPTVNSCQKLFDEENTQRHFFDSVYARRHDQEHYKVDSPTANFIDYLHMTLKQRQRAIMIHLYTESDSVSNTEYLILLLTYPCYPHKFLIDIILDQSNSTLMHCAATYGRLDIVRLLISKGMKIDGANINGSTPLMDAIESSRNYTNNSMSGLVALLGPSIFAKDAKNLTAFHRAVNLARYKSKRKISNHYMKCLFKFVDDTRLVTKTDISLDSQDDNGNTALILACRFRSHEIARMLLNRGALRTLENNAGESALSISQYDFRLLKLMQIDDSSRCAAYDLDDAPTTPMSQASDDYVINPSHTITNDAHQLPNLPEQDSITRQALHAIEEKSQFFSSVRFEIGEIKYYTQQFSIAHEFASKITKAGDVGEERVEEHKRIKLDKNLSHRNAMTETKLSSRLIRLDSLLKVSVDEQNDVLTKIQFINRERDFKSCRYDDMLSSMIRVTPLVLKGVFDTYSNMV